MDVALDANIYLSDPRMEGVAFRSLLDYLRKTKSALVLPRIVLDEVVARYPERAMPQVKKAISEISSLRRLIVTTQIREIPKLDLKKEARALRRKLLKPSKHVRALLLENFEAVSVEEVARRGVERIPPANSNGEELRDVMTWLMLLAHAKNSGVELAFISQDKHFSSEDRLRTELATEVTEQAVKLHFYISIDDFIKSHAPAPRELSAEDAFDLYSQANVLDRFEIEARKYFPTFWRAATSIECIDRDIKVIRGALYDVGPNSQYGEMEFIGELLICVTTPSSASFTLRNQPFIGGVGELVPYRNLLSPAEPAVVIPARSIYAPRFTLDQGSTLSIRAN